MKFKLLTIGLLSSLFTMTASADLLKIDIGGGIWSQTPSGKTTYDKNGIQGSDTIIEKQKIQGYGWADLKLFISVIPNLHFEYNKLSYTGIVEGGTDKYIIPINETSSSSLSINQFSLAPYYNILDNTFWTTIDVGLDISLLNYDYNIAPVVDNTTNLVVFEGYHKKGNIVLPSAYLHTSVKIPSTNLGIESNVKYLKYQNNDFLSLTIKANYYFKTLPMLKTGVEAGYKYEKIHLNDNDGTNVDMKFSKFFTGLFIKF